MVVARTVVLGSLAAGILSSVAPGKSSPSGKSGDDGWVPLFNGQDLTGWKMVNPPSGQFESVTAKASAEGKVVAYDGKLKNGKTETLWRVEDGLLIGAGTASHLFSEKEYDDFHYRVEAKINDKGNSGQYFRTQFGPGFPKGYEVQINATHRDPVKTGSLHPNSGPALGKLRDEITVLNTAPHKPDEFFTQEVIADGYHITILVNGKKTVDITDPGKTFAKGHFALQGHDPGTVVTFRKIEYKPLKK
jgi:hypothetical protein